MADKNKRMIGMTGKQAWDKIRPYIDPMTHPELNTEEFAEAFCITYIALKEMDVKLGDVYDKKNSK